MKAAIIYTSKTGNTEELALELRTHFSRRIHTDLFTINRFPLSQLHEYEAIIIGTYTWGDGEIPLEMMSLYQWIEREEASHLTTGVFGTGDSFYPNFCGAVDEFRDMLYVHTNLAATLKVELSPQEGDWEKCEKFADILMNRIKQPV
ncbi:flavodoxin [Bacillus sp. FJAT-27916]|uniref:flavodoxin domain-containing protein n=1 Tax=Bacillaceae TaxID=186817 RepID=UPI0006707F00|nr:flavodoxin domain-containing protein [Bacillus sp. FJAT-27916]KMY43088.1 flavodoxin [Bacillus sp. FJAT-27916]